MLTHEKLDVYQCSIQFLALASQQAENVPRGHGDIRHQLRKTSLSIPLNIAEATGKTRNSDRQNFFAIARGSAHESAALWDALDVIGAIDPADFDQGKQLLKRIIQMLTKLARDG